MNIFLGFDPGGDGSFGWAVCHQDGNALRVMATGRAGYAKDAVAQALSVPSARETIIAAGIDAPLFWTEDGGRDVDELVRRAIQRLGAATPGGTVQHFNSLRGACLVQGILTAKLLHEQLPHTTLSESHPKALLYLLGVANAKINPTIVTLRDLSNHVTCDARVGEHERDAVLAAITAFAQAERPREWVNLFERERRPVIPFAYPVAYWMPWHLIKEEPHNYVMEPTPYSRGSSPR
jgi:hypothetical protein